MKKHAPEQSDLSNAEMMGNLPTLPSAVDPVTLIPVKEVEKIVDDAHEFEVELARARMEKKSVTISDRLWGFIVNNQQTPYLMYKGVRVFRPGTKEIIEKEMAMSADDYHNYITRKPKQ
jgi:hypothetical protein